MKYKLKIWGLFLFIIILIIVSIVVTLYVTDAIDDFKQDYFVAIISSIAGGLIAILGVILTIIVAKNKEKQDMSYMNKPELFIPLKYKISDSTIIKMIANNNWQISNNTIYIKNSDKASFLIEKFICNNEIEFKPCTTSFIEKNNLFCLSFFCEQKVNSIQLFICGMTKEKFTLEIKIDGDNYELMEVKNESK